MHLLDGIISIGHILHIVSRKKRNKQNPPEEEEAYDADDSGNTCVNCVGRPVTTGIGVIDVRHVANKQDYGLSKDEEGHSDISYSLGGNCCVLRGPDDRKFILEGACVFEVSLVGLLLNAVGDCVFFPVVDDVVIDVGRHAHDIEGRVYALDEEHAGVVIVSLQDVVFFLDLEPESVHVEVEIGQVHRAVEEGPTQEGRVGGVRLDEHRFDQIRVPDVRDVDYRATRVQDGVDTIQSIKDILLLVVLEGVGVFLASADAQTLAGERPEVVVKALQLELFPSGLCLAQIAHIDIRDRVLDEIRSELGLGQVQTSQKELLVARVLVRRSYDGIDAFRHANDAGGRGLKFRSLFNQE